MPERRKSIFEPGSLPFELQNIGLGFAEGSADLMEGAAAFLEGLLRSQGGSPGMAQSAGRAVREGLIPGAVLERLFQDETPPPAIFSPTRAQETLIRPEVFPEGIPPAEGESALGRAFRGAGRAAPFLLASGPAVAGATGASLPAVLGTEGTLALAGSAAEAGAAEKLEREDIDPGLGPVLLGLGATMAAPGAQGSKIAKVQKALTSRFTPLRKFEEAVRGVPARKFDELDLASRFELLSSAAAQSQGDVLHFDRLVREPAGESLQDVERLVGTLLDEPKKLTERVQGLTLEQRAKAERALEGIDQFSREVLGQEIQAGRISQNSVEALDTPQARLQAALDVQIGPARPGQERFKPRTLDEISAVFAAGRGPREWNRRLNDLAEVARLDPDNEMVRVVEASERAAVKAAGFTTIPFKHTKAVTPRVTAQAALPGIQPGGRPVAAAPRTERTGTSYLAVRGEVADALKDLGPSKQDTLVRIASGANALFRFGATTASLPFQVVNVTVRDPLRMAVFGDLTGVQIGARAIQQGFQRLRRDPKAALDLFAIEWFRTLGESAVANGFPAGKVSDTYIEFLRSGAAGSGFQRAFQPEQFLQGEKLGRVERAVRPIVLAANALEETTKLLGYKRGLRRLGPNPTPEDVEKLASEVRKFAGSPDFFRRGELSATDRYALRNLNFLFVFFNARLQGTGADLSVLGGRHGARRAAEAWTKLTATATIPTVMAYKINSSDEEIEIDGPLGKIKTSNLQDWERMTDFEKESFPISIPLASYHVNENGEVVRNRLKLPIGDTARTAAKTTLGFLRALTGEDPDLIRRLPIETMEELSPINIEGDNAQEVLESMAGSMNAFPRSFAELATGRDFFRHRDITPERIGPVRSRDLPPEQRVTDDTSLPAQKIAEVIAAYGRATGREGFAPDPNALDQFVNSLTGGLPRQFSPREAQEGQSPLRNVPGLGGLISRFTGSSAVETDPRLTEIVERNTGLQAQEALRTFREAESERERIKQLPPAQQVEEVRKLRAEKPEVYRRIELDQAKRDKSFAERMLRNQGVEFRAKSIIELLAGLPFQEKLDRLNDLERKKILTKAVKRAIAKQGGIP